MNCLACPEDARLWPIIVGEPLRGDVAEHFDSCALCQQRVGDWRSQLTLYREANEAAIQIKVKPEQAASLLERIGDYQILGLLGQGGQAIVYRAWHPGSRPKSPSNACCQRPPKTASW